jgi:hypothetical protein
MIDTQRLADLIVTCDFTYAEIEQLCGGYLDLRAERLENVLGNGRGAWQHRLADLVHWADRQGLLGDLYRGVLHYGGGKRAVQEFILDSSGPAMTMQQQTPGDYTLLRIETKIDAISSDQQELKHRVLTLEQRLAGNPLSWTIILLAVLVGVAVVVGTATMAFVR